MKIIMNMVQGFCMALADSVPGVSGGTIAFILGFYDEFIESLNNLMSMDKEKIKKSISFLVKLGIGWVIGFSMSVLFLGNIFDSHIYELCSLFIGLSVFALPIIIKEEQDSLKNNYKNLIFMLIGIAIVVLITVLGPSSSGNSGMDISKLSIGSIIYIFVSAMIAISAMVLPGISGSTLLLIFGLYVPIISAIKDFLHFNFKYVPALMIFGIGVIVGILMSIRLLKKGLEKYRSQMIYLILGLVIGSIYAIVKGPMTLAIPQAAMTLSTFHPIFFLLGGVILFGLQMLKKVTEEK